MLRKSISEVMDARARLLLAVASETTLMATGSADLAKDYRSFGMPRERLRQRSLCRSYLGGNRSIRL